MKPFNFMFMLENAYVRIYMRIIDIDIVHK
jgi:hypothetical protein